MSEEAEMKDEAAKGVVASPSLEFDAKASHSLEFDASLIAKYDRPGPRYTSYPTAPNFNAQFDAAAYARHLEESNRPGPAGLSLYIHLPFCEKLCYFCGCNMVVRSDHGRSYPYLDKLEREMDSVAARLDFETAPRTVQQIHLGGGTPTFLPPPALERLAAALAARFPIAAAAERGVEVHPNETREEHLAVLAAHGWRRISIGIQDFDPQVQKAVNRIQTEEQTRETIATARGLGYDSVNVDLMYGLPFQRLERFSGTVDKIVALEPDRIALFNFAYLPEMIKHQRVLDPAALPSPREKLAILEMAIERFTAAGYVFIGMDHFARATDELAVAQRAGTLHRNFQGYSTHKGLDLIGLGVSAISQLERCYAQNAKELPLYEKRAENAELATARGIELTGDDLMRRELIMGLISNFRLDIAAYELRHGIDFRQTFAAALADLAPMAADGLLEIQDARLEVTPKGRLLVRNVCMPFDAYLRPTEPAEPELAQPKRHSFSRTV